MSEPEAVQAKVLTMDEARRVAANMARLLELLGAKAGGGLSASSGPARPPAGAGLYPGMRGRGAPNHVQSLNLLEGTLAKQSQCGGDA